VIPVPQSPSTDTLRLALGVAAVEVRVDEEAGLVDEEAGRVDEEAGRVEEEVRIVEEEVPEPQVP
jgi:hypothetical protein